MRVSMRVLVGSAVFLAWVVSPLLAQEAYLLRYQVPVGNQAAYQASFAGAGELIFGQQRQTLTVEAAFSVVERVLEALADGSRRVETEIQAAEIKVNGAQTTAGWTGAKMRTVRDALGRVTSAETEAPAALKDMYGLDLNTLIVDLSKIVSWPEAAVTVGQTWDAGGPVAPGSGQTVTVSATSVLRAVEPSPLGTVGYIDTKLSVPMDVLSPLGYRLVGTVNSNLRTAIRLEDGLTLGIPQVRAAVAIQFYAATDGQTPVGSLTMPDLLGSVSLAPAPPGQ